MVQRLQKNPKNPKKSTIKSRITAALVAVVALVPALLLYVGAYPAENVIPPTSTVSVGGSALDYGYYYFETYNLDGQDVGDEFEYTFGNLRYSMADATQSWRYLAAQFTIEDTSGVFGHYSIGLCRDASDTLRLRIGYDYTINGVRYENFPVYAPLTTEAVGYLFGFRVSRQTDGTSLIYAEALVLDNNNTIIETGYMSVPIPTQATRGAVELKTNYARIISVDVIDNTALKPHMPTDLLGVEQAYKDGQQNIRDTGEVVSSTIWQIISMPFDILASVLNFDIFGINVWAVATTLLTIGLIFWVLKKVGVF